MISMDQLLQQQRVGPREGLRSHYSSSGCILVCALVFALTSSTAEIRISLHSSIEASLSRADRAFSKLPDWDLN